MSFYIVNTEQLYTLATFSKLVERDTKAAVKASKSKFTYHYTRKKGPKWIAEQYKHCDQARR